MRNPVTNEKVVGIPGDAAIFPIATSLDFVDNNLNAYVPREVWQQTRGRGISVAVIDSGCDIQHPDLQHVTKSNFTNSPYSADDVNSHGTWVSGVLFGNGPKYNGIIPEAKAYSIKALNDRGVGTITSLKNAIIHAGLLDVDILVCSWGGKDLGDELRQAFLDFYSERPGRFIFCAAGNEGHNTYDTIIDPAAYDFVFAIGAVDWDGTPAPFSSAGPEVDFVVPGVEIVAPIPVEKGSYGIMSGTSMANPIAAGLAGLILAHHRTGSVDDHKTPVITFNDMMEHLKRACVDLDSPGWDSLTGFGLIDPTKLYEAQEGTNDPPTAKLAYQVEAENKVISVITSEHTPHRGDIIKLL